MKKTLMLAVITAYYILPIWAQNPILEKINTIKKQNDTFFWNEYTHPNADSAVVNASMWLLDEINAGRTRKLRLTDIISIVKHIKMDRGRLTRAFVYAKRAEVPDESSTGVAVATMPGHVSHDVQSPPLTAKPFVPDVFVQKIMSLKNFYKVYDFLRVQKAQGQLLQFGPLKDVEDYSSLDLMLFDMDSRELVAMLASATQGGNRTNLMTGQLDSLDNYPEDMTLVIWYIK